MGWRRDGAGGFAARLFCHSTAFRADNASRKGAVLNAIFEEVAVTGSTNADLVARAAIGAPEGLWLRADRQDSGRGRMGRIWESADGNMYASTIVRLRDGDPPPSSLGFLASLAVYETVRIIAPDVPAQIKWPNDLLTQAGEKICGILLERSGDAVIVGIGLNLRSHPDGLDRPVSNLSAKGANPPPAQAVVEMLADIFARQLNIWRAGGLPNILRAWQANAHPQDTGLTVNLPNGERLEGLFAGLDADGALKLRLAGGDIRAIHAADVFLV